MFYTYNMLFVDSKISNMLLKLSNKELQVTEWEHQTPVYDVFKVMHSHLEKLEKANFIWDLIIVTWGKCLITRHHGVHKDHYLRISSY